MTSQHLCAIKLHDGRDLVIRAVARRIGASPSAVAKIHYENLRLARPIYRTR